MNNEASILSILTGGLAYSGCVTVMEAPPQSPKPYARGLKLSSWRAAAQQSFVSTLLL